MARSADYADRRIVGLDVEDNVIGFTDRNYDSFCTAVSRLKEERGGKGVGTLSWLEVFGQISIENTYMQNEIPHYRLAGGELRLHLAPRINDPEREAQTMSLPAELEVCESSGAPAAN